MSWVKSHYDLYSQCACGKLKIVRHIVEKEDDWSRSETNISGEEILCDECKKNYHISHLFNYSYKGIVYQDIAFLVPNDIQMPCVKEEHSFIFFNVDERIVSTFSLSEIKSAITDMLDNKFSTRLKLSQSKSIVKMYHQKYNTKKLNNIIPYLKSIIQNYDDYEWNTKTIDEFRQKQQIEIEENNKKIEEAISRSYLLHFSKYYFND